MYLNELVHERAEQEVRLETMALDLEAAKQQITTLEMENQRLREQLGLDTTTRPIRSRRVRQEPDVAPAIDSEPEIKAPKKNGGPSPDDVAEIPDLEIAPLEEDASPPALDARPASLKRRDAPDSDGSFLPQQTAPGEQELPEPDDENALTSAESQVDDAQQAVSLTIDKTQTRGEDLDGHPGDEGILVVLQTRDSRGVYIPQNGSVVIEVVDAPNANKSDPTAQVAEWRFSPDEVRRATRNSSLGRGVYLSVDWDEHRPANERLLVIARWKLPSGEELTAEQIVRVNNRKSPIAWDSRLKRTDSSSARTSEAPESIATRPLNRSESGSWAPSRR